MKIKRLYSWRWRFDFSFYFKARFIQIDCCSTKFAKKNIFKFVRKTLVLFLPYQNIFLSQLFYWFFPTTYIQINIPYSHKYNFISLFQLSIYIFSSQLFIWKIKTDFSSLYSYVHERLGVYYFNNNSRSSSSSITLKIESQRLIIIYTQS